MNRGTKVCFTTLNQLSVIPHLYRNKKIVYKVNNNNNNNFYCWVVQFDLTKTVAQGAHENLHGHLYVTFEL